MDETLLFWVTVGVQLFGLISLVAARIGASSEAVPHCQWLFLGSLLTVGVTTVLCLLVGLEHWSAGLATLAVMVVGGTLDLRRDPVYSAL